MFESKPLTNPLSFINNSDPIVIFGFLIVVAIICCAIANWMDG